MVRSVCGDLGSGSARDQGSARGFVMDPSFASEHTSGVVGGLGLVSGFMRDFATGLGFGFDFGGVFEANVRWKAYRFFSASSFVEELGGSVVAELGAGFGLDGGELGTHGLWKGNE